MATIIYNAIIQYIDTISLYLHGYKYTYIGLC